MPVGKPAPPYPVSPDAFSSSTIRSSEGRARRSFEAAARLVVRQRRVAGAEADRRAVVGRVRDRRDDLVAARHRGREVAVTQAGDLDRAWRPLEELARAEAVAHRPGADAHRVCRYLEEGVERDDLVHLAAADVHVVGDGVRELHRDRPDLAAHAAEVVEEACPLAWKLGEQRCESQHVHRGESIPRLEASGAPSSVRGGASPRAVARAPVRSASSRRAGAAQPVPRGASRRVARPRARGCAPGFARPARPRAAPGRRA